MEEKEYEDWTSGLEPPQSDYLKITDKQNAIIEFKDTGRQDTNKFGDVVVYFKVYQSILQTTVDTPSGSRIIDDKIDCEKTLQIKKKSWKILQQISERKKAKTLVGAKASYSRVGSTAKDTRYTLKFFDGITVEKAVIN